MKKSAWFAGAAALLVSCTPKAPENYTITGTTRNNALNGQTVYLCDYTSHTGATIALDSAVIANDTFTFTGKADSAMLRVLRVERRNIGLVLENGEITVDLSVSPRRATGTPLNDRLAAYMNTEDALNNRFEEKIDSIYALQIDEAEKKRLAQAEWNEYRGIRIIRADSLLQANPANPLGVYAFWRQTIGSGFSPAQVDSLYMTVGEAVYNAPLVESIMDHIARLKRTGVGQPFIDFTAENPEGGEVSLSDYAGRGKYVLVDFWASWCGPCRGEMPNIAEIYKTYRDKGLEVVSVAVWDEKDDTMKAIEELNMTWPQIVNAQSVPTELYAIDGIPHLMLFAPDGTIAARGLRGEKIGEKVAEVLNNR